MNNKLAFAIRDFGLQWHANSEMNRLPDRQIGVWKNARNSFIVITLLMATFYIYGTTERVNEYEWALTGGIVSLVVTLALQGVVALLKKANKKETYLPGSRITVDRFYTNHQMTKRQMEGHLNTLCEANGITEVKSLFVEHIKHGENRLHFTGRRDGAEQKFWTDGHDIHDAA